MFELELLATGADGGLTVRLMVRSAVIGVVPAVALKGPMPRTCSETGLQSVPGCVQLKSLEPAVKESPVEGDVAGTRSSVVRTLLNWT